MSIYTNPDFDHHELVSFKDDKSTGLRAIIAVHNSNLGPALGGCRMFPYTNEAAALSDVLRLSRGMTYKSALAGLPLGGGKAVIMGDPRKDKTRKLMLAMGEFIESQNGRYISAEDSGTGVEDIATMAESTKYISGLVKGEKHGGDPSPTTAYGVFQGLKAAVRYKYNSDLIGVRIAIQGVGNVGYHLASYLQSAGAKVLAADIHRENIDRAVTELGVEEVGINDILSADVDVLAPCAMGGAVNPQSLLSIKAGIIAGAANNQLATKDMGMALLEQDILYAPDYVINSGGIIDAFYQTTGNRDTVVLRNHVDRIGGTLMEIFHRANELGRSTSSVADLMAEEVFEKSGKENKVA